MKLSKLAVNVLVGLGLLLVPTLSYADGLALKIEPGLALPLTKPQSQLFDPGIAQSVKGYYGLTSYLDIGPSASFLYLPAANSAVHSGSAWSVGGGLRLKRPHEDGDVSPWIDSDLQYTHTGEVGRPSISVAVGVAAPLDDARSLWFGPFVRYQNVIQTSGDSLDNRNAKVAIVGLSLEFGKGAEPKPVIVKTVEVRQVPCPKPEPTPPVVEKKVVPVAPLELKHKIQFAWDSAALDQVATKTLDEVAKKLQDNKNYRVQVQGHASSEGQVAHNTVLSLNRAKAVLAYLVSKGVAANRLETKAFGSSVAVESNSTTAGRVANRRAEFVLLIVE